MNYEGAETVRSLLTEQQEIINNLLYENNLASKTIEELQEQNIDLDKEILELKEKLKEKDEPPRNVGCDFCSENLPFEVDDIALTIENNELIIKAYAPMGWKRNYKKFILFCPLCGRALL